MDSLVDLQVPLKELRHILSANFLNLKHDAILYHYIFNTYFTPRRLPEDSGRYNAATRE